MKLELVYFLALVLIFFVWTFAVSVFAYKSGLRDGKRRGIENASGTYLPGERGPTRIDNVEKEG